MISYKTIQNILFAIFLGLTFSACATIVPPESIEDSNIPSGLTMDQIKQAIISAGHVRDWKITEVAPGKLEAVYKIRAHTVNNEILFNQSSYSIKYKDSVNMKYDSEKNVIHGRYNSWTENLNNDIQHKLSLLQ